MNVSIIPPFFPTLKSYSWKLEVGVELFAAAFFASLSARDGFAAASHFSEFLSTPCFDFAEINSREATQQGHS